MEICGAFSANVFAGHEIDPKILGKNLKKGEAILLPLGFFGSVLSRCRLSRKYS